MNHVTRKPRLALIAALSMPGLGQLYVGDLPRGLCFLLGVAFSVPGAVRLGLLCPSRCLCWIVLLGVVSALALYAWSVIDAVHCARRGAGVASHSWQRRSVYGLYVIASYAFVLGPSTASVRRDFLEAFVVPSASMSPGILPGDRIFADKTIGQPGGTKLWRGAPVVFIYPNDRTSIFIKRIVGLPGDEIEIAGTELRVNGHSVSLGPSSEPLPSAFTGLRAFRERGDRGEYTVLWPQNEEPAETAAAPTRFVVPAGQVLVLGDNRAASVDSRRFGTVPVADVKAVARQIWFSVSAQDGVRWRRLGRLLG